MAGPSPGVDQRANFVHVDDDHLRGRGWSLPV